MAITSDTKVPDRRTPVPSFAPHEARDMSSGDSGLDRKAITESSLASSSTSVKSRLPWLDGRNSPRKSEIQTVYVSGANNKFASIPDIKGPSPSPISSPMPAPQPFRNRKRLDRMIHSHNKPNVESQLIVTSGPTATSSESSHRPFKPSPLRRRFPEVDTSNRLARATRPSRELRVPTPQPHMVPQKSPLTITRVKHARKKGRLPVQTESIMVVPEPGERYPAPKSEPLVPQANPLTLSSPERWPHEKPSSRLPAAKPMPATWFSPERWPNDTTSPSDLISPKSHPYLQTHRELPAREVRRSFHEPEMHAAMDRLELLMQEAENLAEEAGEAGRPQERFRNIDLAPVASSKAPRYPEIPRPRPQTRPLRFRVTNTSSEMGPSTVTSSSSETVVRSSQYQTNSAVRHTNGHGRRPKSDQGHTTRNEFDTDRSRGRNPQRDFAYLQPTRSSRSRSSSPHKHWIGRRPTQNFTAHPNAQIDSTMMRERPNRVHVPHTVREPVSSPDNIMRHRISTTNPGHPRPWVPAHHSTAYDPTDTFQRPPPKTRDYVNWDDHSSKRDRYRNYQAFEKPEYREGGDLEKRRQRRSETMSHERRRSGENLHVKRDPIARRWVISRKRFVGVVACINTALVGFTVGVYAGMVPRIQFALADQHHYVLWGNIVLYIGLAVSTFLFWPLPLLHGRKPYVLASLALVIPIQFPEALIVASARSPTYWGFEFGLLMLRFLTGFFLGFANINFFATLLDLYGSSLQSERPHQEIVIRNDVRRDGGGLGLWLGIWTWCCIGSISVGFFSGAGIIFGLNPAWGFYISVIFMVFVLVLNIMTPDTRHHAHKRSFKDFLAADEKIRHKFAKGEIKLHISEEGPKNSFQEIKAGITLSKRMFCQRGFSILSLYLGWIYGLNVLLIVLLGALLSTSYRLPARVVGCGVLAIAAGALLAVPLTKGGLFSRARKQGPRTDSMTFEKQITMSSHLVRRTLFMAMLPIAGIAYTIASPGIGVHYSIPILFAAAIGFLSNLSISECLGLIMETYDTCDLQPGVNSKHRLQSIAESIRKRRTSYTCYPRVTAGIMVAQCIGYIVAAAATGVGGILARNLGPQVSTGITAGVLMLLTLLLTLALWRFKNLQVVPDQTFGTQGSRGELGDTGDPNDEFWKPVIIGNPSGKMRRFSLLEMGALSRWTEIRKLNKLVPNND